MFVSKFTSSVKVIERVKTSILWRILYQANNTQTKLESHVVHKSRFGPLHYKESGPL